MQLSIHARLLLGAALCLVASAVTADPEPLSLDKMLTGIDARFDETLKSDEVILEAAKNLFAFLATISLVWTMSLQILRQDIGEVLMELLRFTIVTGTMYWLLINASEHAGGEGFVQKIVASFYQLNHGQAFDDFPAGGDGAMRRALQVYLKVIADTAEGDDGERVVSGLIGIIVLIALTLLAAQFLVALVMAWFLGYGGIFLLGFGGARWSSQIAVSYYKHVIALGVSILALGVIGAISESLLGEIVPSQQMRAELPYAKLGEILAISVLMLVLGIRVPQLLYTLVTGSSLGLFAGTAGLIGSAIATGGGAAFASASGRFPSGDGGAASNGSTARSGSAMEAIERSAVSVGGIADPFHVVGGSDPFGVPRAADAHRGTGAGSVFDSAGSGSADATPMSVPAMGIGGGSSAYGSTESAASMGGAHGWPSGLGEAAASRSSTMARETDAQVASQADAGDTQEPGRPDYMAEMSAITSARSDSFSTTTEAFHSSDATHSQSESHAASAMDPPSIDKATSAAVTTGAVTELPSADSTDTDVGGEIRPIDKEISSPLPHASEGGAHATSVGTARAAETKGGDSSHQEIGHLIHGSLAESGTIGSGANESEAHTEQHRHTEASPDMSDTAAAKPLDESRTTTAPGDGSDIPFAPTDDAPSEPQRTETSVRVSLPMPDPPVVTASVEVAAEAPAAPDDTGADEEQAS